MPMDDMDMGGKMPPEVEEADEKVKQATMSSIGKTAPQAGSALTPERVGRLQEVLIEATNTLSGGQVPVEPYPVPEEPMGQLPPEVYSLLVAFVEGLKAAADAGVKRASKYVFNPKEVASSDAGLETAMQKIVGAMQDEALVDALNSGPAGEEKPPAEEEPKEKEPAKEEPEDEFEGLL